MPSHKTQPITCATGIAASPMNPATAPTTMINGSAGRAKKVATGAEKRNDTAITGNQRGYRKHCSEADAEAVGD